MALEITNLRALSAESEKRAPGPEASILKIKGTEIQQTLSELMMYAVGPYALPFERGSSEEGDLRSAAGPDYAAPLAATYCNYRKVIDLRRLQRDPAQHHCPDDSGPVTRSSAPDKVIMDFNFSEEQQLLADTVQRFVREHYAFETRREILKSKAGWSREVWQSLAGLGLTALNVPEEHGGLGGGPVDTMLVMNALGDGLVRGAFPERCGASRPPCSRASATTAAAADLLPHVASGERIVIVAHQEPRTRGELNVTSRRAPRRAAMAMSSTATRASIVHGGAADEFLITARTQGKHRRHDGVSRLPRRPKAAGVTVTGLPHDRRPARRRHRN